jgi:hypothetical protein
LAIENLSSRDALTWVSRDGAFGRLVALASKDYLEDVKTLTVQEASRSLGDWLRRAVGGEQIAINEGGCTVLLQPVSESQQALAAKALSAREALRRLQSGSRLSATQAAEYLREVYAERSTDGRRNDQ